MMLRVLALAIILVEAVVLCLFTATWTVAIGLALIAFVAFFIRVTFNPRLDRRVIISLLLALPFSIWYVLFLDADTVDNGMLGASTLLLAYYFFGLQVLQFFWKHRDGMPPILPLFGVITLTFAGDVSNSEKYMMNLYFGLSMVFALISISYYHLLYPRVGNKSQAIVPRRIWIAVAVILSISLAWGTVVGIQTLFWPVENFFSGFFYSPDLSSLGNRNSSKLGSLQKFKEEEASRVALHILAEEEPGYLRARVFDEYQSREWSYHGDKKNLSPVRVKPEELPEYDVPGPWFRVPLIQSGKSEIHTLEVYPESLITAAMHIPASTSWLSIGGQQPLSDEFGVIESAEDLNGRRYVAFANPQLSPATLSDEDWERFTKLPEDLTPKVKELVDEKLSEVESPAGKALIIAQYFRTNYKYQIGIDIPVDRDPMEYFLSEKPPAHCEYFASAAALMLRESGVPSRYVTGVLAWEKSNLGDYWIARNRDAHAWVEAFISDDNQPGSPGVWQIVEATPSDGMPQALEEKRGGPFSDFLDAIRFQITRIVASIKEGDWIGGLQAMGAVLVAVLRWLCLTWTGWLCLGVLGYRFWRLAKRRGWFILRRDKRAHMPEYADLWRLLRRADKAMKQQGFERAQGETLNKFAVRIEQAGAQDWAGWYRDYARLRYGVTVTEAAVEDLAEQFPVSQKAK